MPRRKGDKDKSKRKRRGEKEKGSAASPTEVPDAGLLAASLLQEHQHQQQAQQRVDLVAEQNQILHDSGLVSNKYFIF